MINKKASISATLTWMVAGFIVFFILFLFLVAVVLIDFKGKGLRTNVVKEDVPQDLVYTQMALSYLNSKINGVSVKNLIREKGYESKEEVSKHTSDFFNDLDLVWDVQVFEIDEIGTGTPRSYILGNKRPGCDLRERKVEVISPFGETGKITIRVFICKEAREVNTLDSIS